MTNLGWIIDKAALEKQFGYRVGVLNDFEAVGYGVRFVDPSKVVRQPSASLDTDTHLCQTLSLSLLICVSLSLLITHFSPSFSSAGFERVPGDAEGSYCRAGTRDRARRGAAVLGRESGEGQTRQPHMGGI
jgi:hypothetical protein